MTIDEQFQGFERKYSALNRQYKPGSEESQAYSFIVSGIDAGRIVETKQQRVSYLLLTIVGSVEDFESSRAREILRNAADELANIIGLPLHNHWHR